MNLKLLLHGRVVPAADSMPTNQLGYQNADISGAEFQVLTQNLSQNDVS